MQPITNNQATVALPNKLSKTKFHKVTGNTGLKYLPSTAKYMDIQLTKSISKCVHCAREMMCQANIAKENSNKPVDPGERMYLDITSMRHPSFGKRLHWALMVNDTTHYKKCFFFSIRMTKLSQFLLGSSSYSITTRSK